MSSGPIVVVGVGRSGTSLIQAMLHAHPKLIFLPETHFFRRYVASPLRRCWWKWRGPEKLRQELHTDSEFARADVEPEMLLKPFLGDLALFEPHRAYLRLLEVYRRRSGTDRIGDKDPRLIDFLPALHQFVPGVRVVHVVRDPRDVLMSRRKSAWSRGRPDWSHILAYRAQMSLAKRTGPRFLGQGYLEIRYEDLLRQPEETLTRVCRHVGVEFHPAMMSFSEAAGELVAEDEWQWKKETTGPLQRDNMRKWDGALSPETRRLAERLCIDPFPEHKYSPASGGKSDEESPVLRWSLRGAQLLGKVLSRLYPLRTLLG